MIKINDIEATYLQMLLDDVADYLFPTNKVVSKKFKYNLSVEYSVSMKEKNIVTWFNV
jgi:hypothetical protein